MSDATRRFRGRVSFGKSEQFPGQAYRPRYAVAQVFELGVSWPRGMALSYKS